MKSRGWSVYPKLEAYIYENYKSVTHFAWVVGVSPTTIYNILHGKNDPSYETLCAIFSATQVPTDEMFQQAET